MSTPPSPFHLVSAALFQARHPLQEATFKKWRTLLMRLEHYRGAIDPMADQNANLDVLLRSIEGNVEEELETHGNLERETAGFQFHLHLSRLWVLGTYEFLRTLHSQVKRHSHPEATCMRATNSRGCGEATCVCCAIGHIKNEAALVRMVLAKNEAAKDVVHPPLTDAMRMQINAESPTDLPPNAKFLFEGECRVGGAIAWVVNDHRVDRYRLVSRVVLSDRVLNMLSGVKGSPSS